MYPADTMTSQVSGGQCSGRKGLSATAYGLGGADGVGVEQFSDTASGSSRVVPFFPGSSLYGTTRDGSDTASRGFQVRWMRMDRFRFPPESRLRESVIPYTFCNAGASLRIAPVKALADLGHPSGGLLPAGVTA